jgi:hypothetical protein
VAALVGNFIVEASTGLAVEFLVESEPTSTIFEHGYDFIERRRDGRSGEFLGAPFRVYVNA